MINKQFATLKKIDTSKAMYSTNPHQQLLEAISDLSETQTQIVLQFIQSIQPKQIAETSSQPFDPLVNFVGATNHGNLAQQIDQTLYE